mgnify:CR=1 FL=1
MNYLESMTWWELLAAAICIYTVAWSLAQAREASKELETWREEAIALQRVIDGNNQYQIARNKDFRREVEAVRLVSHKNCKDVVDVMLSHEWVESHLVSVAAKVVLMQNSVQSNDAMLTALDNRLRALEPAADGSKDADL